MKLPTLLSTKQRIKSTLLIALAFSLFLVKPLFAQNLAEINLASLESMIGELADHATSQQQQKQALIDVMAIDLEQLEFLRSEEARYRAEGDTARELTITAQLIQHESDYANKEIELELITELIDIYTQYSEYSQTTFEQYEHAWLADAQTADVVNQVYYALLDNYYDAVQQAYQSAADARLALSDDLDQQTAPEGTETMIELAGDVAEAAYYNEQRRDQYNESIRFAEDINGGWGMNASATVLAKQAAIYELMADVFTELNEKIQASYAKLSQAHGTNSQPDLANFYASRQAPSAAAPQQFKAIAEGLRNQLDILSAKGSESDIAAPSLRLADKFDYAAKTNQKLAQAYAQMSAADYWNALYQRAKLAIDLDIEENQAQIDNFEQLVAEAQEYDAEYERVINDEDGVQHFTDIGELPDAPEAPDATLTTVPAQGSEGYYVGSISGAMEIGSDGQPGWSMPITMPPGVRGLSPKLTLSVNASGGVGVSGTSSIGRCGANIADDGFNRPVDFSYDDYFCYNGQRLVVINGNYGAPGSEYRTRIESFERIIAHGTSGNGPASFTVHTSSGGTLYFGDSSETQTRLNGDATVASWQLSHLTDVSGNGVFYRYTDQSTTNVEEIVLSEINYGGKTLPAAKLSVKLDYEPRPDTAHGYRNGEQIQSTLRLKRITSQATDKVRRQYTLNYEQGEISGNSRISSIRECAGIEASAPCYRPTYFTYTPETAGWQALAQSQPDALQNNQGQDRGVILDINNDGLNDWITAVTDTSGGTTLKTWLGSTTGWQQSTDYTLPAVLYDYSIVNEGLPLSQLADVNGDGFVDLVQAYQNDTTRINKIWQNTGQGFSLTTWQLPEVLFSINAANETTGMARFTDVNADALPDVLIATRDSGGTIHQKTWLNTTTNSQPNWTIASNFTPPAILLDYENNIDGIGLGELIDINSDGLVDTVISATTPSGTTNSVYLNTGNGWQLNNDYQLPIVLSDYTANTKGTSNGELTDINGDGLVDIWQAIKDVNDQYHYSAWLNTGKGFIVANEFTPPWYSYHQRNDGYTSQYGTLTDLDADGQPEFVVYYRAVDNITYLNIWRHDGNNWINARSELADRLTSIPLFQHFTNANSIGLVQAGDLNHDHVPEIFSSFEGVANGQIVYSAPIAPENEQPGLLVETINGLKIATRLEYGISTDQNLYTPSSEPSIYPLISPSSPMLLVKRVHKMDGLIHPDKINTTPGTQGWYSVDHFYAGMRVDVHRGSLGFALKRISDDRTGTIIESQFNQTWPHIGLNTQSGSYLNDQLISKSETEFSTLSLNNNRTIYPYTPTSTAYGYENDQLVTSTIKSSKIDNFGNRIEELSIVTDGNERVEKLIKRSYDNDTTNWILGKQVETTMTVSAPNTPDISHTTKTIYDLNGYVLTDILEPNHSQSVKTDYQYDEFGNVTETRVSADGDNRVSTSTYTVDGRFSHTATNPLGHTVIVEYASTSGKVLRQTDANGLIKETVYNAFDSVIKEEMKREETPGQREIALPYWCESSTEPACPENALYFVAALDDQGESPQTVYFDAYGREILKKSLGWQSKTVYLATQYDALGRKVATSKPSFDLDNLDWVSVNYDQRDRVASRVSPSGEVTKYEYSTFSKTTINTLGQRITVKQNLQGKPIESTDNDGNLTRYQYDAEGKLLTTIDSAGNRIETRYDLFGRKLLINDPNLGETSFEYDSFGNLIKQTDAKVQTVTMQYDLLGRLIKRSEAEGDTTWQYDTAVLGDIGQAKGALHSVNGPNGYNRIHFYDQFARPVKEQTTIKGKTYNTERGYFRASDKVAWTKYPSGLVLRTEQDANGFPKNLASVDLEKYSDYLDASNHYQQLYFDAKDIEAKSKDELDYHKTKFDYYTEQGKPQVDEIQRLYGIADEAGKKANKYGAKANSNAKLARRYYDEYLAAFRSYEQERNAAERAEAQGRPYQQKAIQYGNWAKAWYERFKREYRNLCKAAGREAHDKLHELSYSVGEDGKAFGCYHNEILGNARQEVCWSWRYDRGDGGTGDRSDGNSKPGTNICTRYINAFAWLPTKMVGSFKMLYPADWGAVEKWTSAIEKSGNSAERDVNRAKFYANLAKPYYNKAEYHARRARSYGNTVKAKLNLLNYHEAIATKNKRLYKQQHEIYQTNYALAQEAEATYMATDTYQQLTFHKDEYERIVAPVNAAIQTAKDYEQTVTDKETEVRNSGTTYWQTLEVTADGQIKKAKHGNNVETLWDYDKLGRTTSIDTNNEESELQKLFFEYDAIGNLTSRQDYTNDLFENFNYDSLNRLTQAQLSGTGAQRYNLVGQENQTFQYDELGNLTYKSDVGHYSYGTGMNVGNAGIHALLQTNGDINANFSYDANGNQIQGNGRSIDYSSFNKPLNIVKSGNINQFDYGPERQMIYQLETVNGQTRETAYVGGIYENTTKNGLSEAVHHLRVAKFTVAVVKTTEDLSAVNSTHYLHQDHLDSVVMITDEAGEVVEKNHYDAFGKKRLAVVDLNSQPLAAGIFAITDRSFTGHRYLPGQELVHMKGRVYDPTLGRFISADPHIQNPLNGQSLNRYSYVLNNPLSLSDPSGFFSLNPLKHLKKLLKRIKKIIKLVLKIIKKVIKLVEKVIQKVLSVLPAELRIALAIAVIFVAPHIAGALLSFAPAAVSAIINVVGYGAFKMAIGGFLSGLISTGSLKGALMGGVTGAIAGSFSQFNFGINGNGFIAQTFRGGLRSAFSNGISSKINGGSFSKAFKKGFITGAVMSIGKQIFQGVKDYTSGKAKLYKVEYDDYLKEYTSQDMGLDHKLPDNSKLFVNGVAGDAGQNLYRLGSTHTNSKSYYLFHNPSNGLIADMTESLLGKLTGTSSLSRQLAGVLANAGGTAFVFGHSQGGLILTNALNHLALTSGNNYSNLIIQFHHAAVHRSSAINAISNAGATPGSLDGGFHVHQFDAVSQIIGGNGLSNPINIIGSIVMIPTLFIGPPLSPHTNP